MFLALIALSLSGCATIFTGTTQKITVSSDQPDAEVFVNNAYKGKTPARFSVSKKGNNEVITVKKDGFISQDIATQKGFNGVAILNLINPIAWGIDLLTGAVNRVSPNEYVIKLEAKK